MPRHVARLAAAGAAAGDPRARRRAASSLHQPDLLARRAAVLLAQRPDRVRRRARRAASCCSRPRSTGCRSARRRPTRSRARSPATAPPTRSRSSGWSSWSSAWPSVPRPDDAADALAIAIWVANTERPACASTRGIARQAGVHGPRRRSAPITRGETPATSGRSARRSPRESADHRAGASQRPLAKAR